MTYSNHMNYSDCSHTYQNTNDQYVNSGYNNHSNNGGYNNHADNGGYNDHANYSNHSNGSGCWHDWCWKCNNSGCAKSTGYNNHSNNGGYNNHANSGYNNHSNYTYCSQWYSNHANYTIDYPKSYAMAISYATPDNWTSLTSSIADIKTLREEINKISQVKVAAAVVVNSSCWNNWCWNAAITRPTITAGYDPVNTYNQDAAFATGAQAKKEQINETIYNVERLWQAINGASTSSGLTSRLKVGGEKMEKVDYKEIINKAQELANVNQPASSGYSNHSNNGGYNNNSYANHTNYNV